MPPMMRGTAAALLALVGACAVETEQRETPEPAVTVHGSLAFRESIAPPPGSVAIVTVGEFPDASAPPVAEMSIELENERTIVPFELTAPLSKFVAGRQYVVRASVAGSGGDSHWTTDVAQLIDLTKEESDVGTLLMTRSRSD